MSSIPIASDAIVWRDSRSAWGWLAAAAIPVAIIYFPGIAELWHAWTERPEYGFGIFIPFICAFLIWQRKDRLSRLVDPGSYTGLWLIGLGFILRYAGDLAVAATFIEYGLLFSIFGIALCYLGRSGIRVIAVPLVFLVFMLPLPEFLLLSLSERLQLLSSQLGVWLIRMCDISVFLGGNIIDLGTMKLQVAEACSGLRYLFSLATLAFIAAYFFKGALWRKAVIFLSAVPITVLMNSFRIALAGVTVEHFGRAAAEGVLHEFEGLVIFLGCTLILIAEMWILARLGRQRITLQEAFGLELPAAAPTGARVQYRRATPALRAAAAILALGALVTTFGPRHVYHSPERKAFSVFPMALGDYRGKPRALDQAYLEVLHADDYLMVDYVPEGGLPVNLYIQYYAKQDRDAATHSPRLCIPAGGWEIANLRSRLLPKVRFLGQPLKVNRAVITKGEMTMLVYYWFQQRGRNTTNEYATKFLILWDALTKGRSDGSMVRIITPIRPGEDAMAGDARLTRFAGMLLPRLTPYLPD